MNYPTFFAIDRDRWSDIANGLKPRPAAMMDTLALFAVMIGVAIVLAVLIYLLSWRDRPHTRPRPLVLFLSLCRLHRLRWHDAWLLWRLVGSLQLQNPARLFIEAERFAPQNLPGAWAANPRIPVLREQLFGPEAIERKADAPDAAASVAVAAGVAAGIRNPLAPRQPRPTL